jgi:capsular polysaccharide biosynthesis protein
MDYVKVILKRKKTILFWFFGLAIIAGVISFIMPEIYEIDTALEIGISEKTDGTNKEQLIESPTQLVGKIDGDVYGIKVREDLNISETEWPKIKTENPKDTNLIAISIESKETEKSENILKEVNNLILKEHQDIININKDLFEKRIITIENKIKPLENDIERMKRKIESADREEESLKEKVSSLEQQLIYSQTPGTQYALFNAKQELANKEDDIENLYLSINSLHRTIEDYNSDIDSLRASLAGIKETKVVKAPTISENPIKPNKKLNIAIFGVLGLFIGVFWAFGKEWWESNSV